VTDIIPMDRVIAMAKNAGVLDDALAESLTTKLEGKTVQSIGQTKFALAEQLGDLPNAFEVAGKLLSFMREAELIGLPNAAPAAPAQPSTVNVVMPTRRPEMGLADLFEELVKHPEDADEIIGYIREQSAVRAADRKLNGSGEWAIMSDDETAKLKLNVPETLAYIRHLAAEHTQPQRTWRGQFWPTTLERALGRDQRLMLYPFAMNDHSQVLLAGPDRYGNDWSNLSDDVHEAIFAAVATDKLVVTSETDVRRITHELFGPELPPYLNDLVEEYKRDKARGNGTVRYATKEQLAAAGLRDSLPGSRLPFSGSEQKHDPKWCRAQLEAVCKRGVDTINGNVGKGRIVVQSLRAVTGNIRLDHTIVLGKIETVTGHITGTAYAGGKARATTGTVGDDVYDKVDDVALYQKAVEFGIIVPS
jgi:hypothetical protein